MDAPTPQDLATSVSTLLPRELRDIIYAYLWKPELPASLNYTALLNSRTKDCEFTHNDDGNEICLCDTDVTLVPDFARAVFVGYDFAREAVAWL